MRYRTAQLRPPAAARAASGAEKQGSDDQFRAAGHLLSAFRAPRAKARPTGDLRRCWTALGFEHQFTYTSAAEVYAEHAQLSAGRLCDVSASATSYWRSTARSNGPLPKASAPNDRSETPLHRSALPNRQTAAPVSAPDLALGLASVRRAITLVLTVGVIWASGTTMTPLTPRSRPGGLHPKPSAECIRWTLLIWPGGRRAAGFTSRRPASRPAVDQAHRIRAARGFCDALGFQAGVWPARPTRSCMSWPAPISGSGA